MWLFNTFNNPLAFGESLFCALSYLVIICIKAHFISISSNLCFKSETDAKILSTLFIIVVSRNIITISKAPEAIIFTEH